MANDYPKMSATFFPGAREDDFAMPATAEVAAPAPQRAQELPASIHENLAQMDLSASKHTSTTGSLHMAAAHPASNPNLDYIDLSSIPRLSNRTPNVPPSDEEKSRILENARVPVLNSTDPDVQLAWAQDTLNLADILADNERLKPGSGLGTMQQLQADAVNIVNFLAEQQHPRALFMRGMWLEFGKFGHAENKTEAFRTYKRAAEKGFGLAEYRMGVQFETTRESIKALQHYKTGEALGDSASCYRMGMTALLGQLGQPLDYDRGIYLIRHAAERADENAPQGAYVFGMLLCGELPQVQVPEAYLSIDVAAGRQHIERAAFLGFAKAQVRMGSAYELCTLGCDFSPILSVHYNTLAAMQGDSQAQMALSRWFLCGAEPTFPKNESLAYKFARFAAKSELADGEFAMGYFHEVGLSVPPNRDEAMMWYRRAAAKGSAEATARIEGISRSGTLTKKDHENVAITRIKSTHGSMRGRRPDRTAKPVTAMPSIPDNTRRTSEVAPAASTTPATSRPGSAMSTPGNRIIPSPYPQNDASVTRMPYPQDGSRRPSGSAIMLKPEPGDSSKPRPANAPSSSPNRSVNHSRSSSGQPIVPSNSRPASGPYPPIPPKEAIAHRSGQPVPIRPGLMDNAGPRREGTPLGLPPGVGSDPLKYARGRTPEGAGRGSGPQRSNRTSPQPPSRPQTTQSQPVQGPVPPRKKGPQTFDEMGIQAGKSGNDCILM